MRLRKNPLCKQTRSGFSLIEVLIAVLILAIGITGIVQGLSTALFSNKDSEILTTAANLAASRIEFIRSDGLLIEGTSEGSWSAPLENYAYTETIAEQELDGLYEIAVTISDQRDGKNLYELKTYLFEAPLEVTSLLSEEDEKERLREEERRR